MISAVSYKCQERRTSTKSPVCEILGHESNDIEHADDLAAAVIRMAASYLNCDLSLSIGILRLLVVGRRKRQNLAEKWSQCANMV